MMIAVRWNLIQVFKKFENHINSKQFFQVTSLFSQSYYQNIKNIKKQNNPDDIAENCSDATLKKVLNMFKKFVLFLSLFDCPQ